MISKSIRFIREVGFAKLTIEEEEESDDEDESARTPPTRATKATEEKKETRILIVRYLQIVGLDSSLVDVSDLLGGIVCSG